MVNYMNTMHFWRAVGVVALGASLFAPSFAFAAELDSDADRLLDSWETRVFQTSPTVADTDGDGFSDGTEVRYGFDPNNAKSGARLKEADFDRDGLSDAKEVAFGSDPTKSDTDGDSYADGTEVDNAFTPTDPAPKPLVKSILIDLSEQRIYQKLDGVTVGTHVVSSGKKSTPTPVGTYKIQTKSVKAWSRSAKLWMPYWMGFRGWTYGIHELPEWPGGKKEGKNHLGIPVSHGCVRVDEGVAKALYEWSPIGTPVTIQR